MSTTTPFRMLPLLLLACAALPAAAQPAAGPSVAAQPAAPASAAPRHADGVVTNQAVTVAGHDFSKYFIDAWRDKDGSERYTLALRERPSARWGSEMAVEYAHRRIYQARLPTARAAIRPLAEEAAEAVYRSVLEADLQRRLLHDADLAADEF